MLAASGTFSVRATAARKAILSATCALAFAMRLSAQPLLPSPPPPPLQWIPPSTSVPQPPGGWTCDENEPATTETACLGNILRDESELRRLHSIADASSDPIFINHIGDRIGYFQQRLARENKALRYIRYHSKRAARAEPR